METMSTTKTLISVRSHGLRIEVLYGRRLRAR
jgi:hypothetical protein